MDLNLKNPFPKVQKELDLWNLYFSLIFMVQNTTLLSVFLKKLTSQEGSDIQTFQTGFKKEHKLKYLSFKMKRKSQLCLKTTFWHLFIEYHTQRKKKLQK